MLGAYVLPGMASAEHQDYLSVFGGRQFENSWETALQEPLDLDYYDEWIAGVAYGREWATRWPDFTVSLEAQANVHFGRQTYGEVVVPAVARYAPDWPAPIRSIAGAVGLSVTTAVPEIEIARGGKSRTGLIYWFLEAEFGSKESQVTPFIRLHHRSDSFGTLGDAGSSNAFVLGFHRRF